MKLQIASDLHLEFHNKHLTSILVPSAPILCLVGDICVCGASGDFQIFINFLRYYSSKFEAIVHIAGNHEYYTASRASPKELSINTIPHIDKKLKDLSKAFSNYHYLQNSTWTYINPQNKKKYVFIGSTLWTAIPNKTIPDKKTNSKINIADLIQARMNDYNFIYMPSTIKTNQFPYRQYTIADMQKKHKVATQFLLRTLAKAKLAYTKAIQAKETPPIFILLTHHKPLFDSSTDKNDIFTYAYANDMAQQLLVSPIALAAHGHTHEHYDKKINGIRVVSNPKGYIGEHTGYNDKFTVNLP